MNLSGTTTNTASSTDRDVSEIPARQSRFIGWLLMALLLICVAALNLRSVGNFDIWWHLSVGRQMVQTKSLASINDFNHTHLNQPYENECWAFDIASYLLWQAAPGGLLGLIALRVILFVLLFAVLLRLLIKTGLSPPLAVALLSLTALLLVQRFYIRNFAAGYLFFAVYLYLLVKPVPGDRRLFWLLPLLMIAWTNIHIGCVTGIILVFIWTLDRIIEALCGRSDWRLVKNAAGVLMLTTLASGIGPYPFIWAKRMYLNLFVYPGSQAMEEIAPPFAEFPLFYFTAAAGLGLLLARWKKTPPLISLSFLFFTVLAGRHVRFIGEYALVLPLLLGATLPDLFAGGPLGKRPGRPWVKSAGALIIAAILIAWTGHLLERQFAPGRGPNCDVLPCRAVEFIREADPQGNFYNTLGYGGFFIWNLYPERRAFWDGRFKAQIDLFEAFRSRPAAEVFADKKVDLALMPFPSGGDRQRRLGLINIEWELVDDQKNWALVHFDQTAMILARKIEANRDLIERYGYRILRPWRLDFSYLDLGDPQQAEALTGDLRLANMELNDQPLPLVLSAALAERQGRPDTSLRLLEAAIARFGDQPLPYRQLGALQVKLERNREAIASLKTALDLGADGGYLRNNLGVAYWRTGDIAKATRQFKKAVSFKPELPEALYNLSEIYRAQGRLKKADRYLKRYEILNTQTD